MALLSRQSVIGLSLATLIIGAWLATHIGLVFFYTWGLHSWLTAPAFVALQCWLSVGLFIIAHDCMHGSLVPFRPGINKWVGRIALGLYAGFSFDGLNRKHHLHHRHSGTDADPDFDDHPPEYGFWHWYLKFFTEYFSWREFLVLAAVVWTYLLVLGAPLANLLVFWSLPAILSSLQLFTFGTYLPHRPGAVPFADRHRARSSNFNWVLSLLTCFHFGYHHEHHLEPSVPWWRLPQVHDKFQGSS